MGLGSFNTTAYAAAATTRRLTGVDDFAYTKSLRSVPRSQWVVHDSLDPKKVAGDASPLAGQVVREARDSVDHPNTVPVAVWLDVTGSMAAVPPLIQAKLPDLLGNLQQKNKIDDPAILFGAVGDATCDRVPLQVGQFESDNSMDEQIRSLMLERGGGSGYQESYELAIYYMARHTVTDAWEQRNKKGYCFIIGDEQPYDEIRNDFVGDIIGAGLQDSISITDIIKEASEKWNLYYILPSQAHGGHNQAVIGRWEELLGVDRVLLLPNTDDICDLIGDEVGKQEALLGLSAIVNPPTP